MRIHPNSEKSSASARTGMAWEDPVVDAYHLNFSNSAVDADFGGDVNTFIRKLWSGRAPIEYQFHSMVIRDGKSFAQVRFELSEMGQRAGISFDNAGRELCRRIFEKSSRRWYSLVTTDDILGISAACVGWRVWFSRAFFSSSIHRGPPLLQEMNAAFRRDYAPSWAIALAFTVLLGANFGPFANVPVLQEAVKSLLGVGGVYAYSILDKYTSNQVAKRTEEDLQRTWEVEHSNFKTSAAAVSQALDVYRAAQSSVPSNDNSQTAEEELCKALYDMIESGALMITCNKDILAAFKESRDKADRDLKLKGASLGLSLWAGYSAFWTTTVVTTEILPILSWGLGDIAGLVFLGEVPILVTTTTTLWWCPPVAVTAAIGAVAFGYAAWKKRAERNEYNKRIKYHE